MQGCPCLNIGIAALGKVTSGIDPDQCDSRRENIAWKHVYTFIFDDMDNEFKGNLITGRGAENGDRGASVLIALSLSLN